LRLSTPHPEPARNGRLRNRKHHAQHIRADRAQPADLLRAGAPTFGQSTQALTPSCSATPARVRRFVRGSRSVCMPRCATKRTTATGLEQLCRYSTRRADGVQGKENAARRHHALGDVAAGVYAVAGGADSVQPSAAAPANGSFAAVNLGRRVTGSGRVHPVTKGRFLAGRGERLVCDGEPR
jgi:hypothetical protein